MNAEEAHIRKTFPHCITKSGRIRGLIRKEWVMELMESYAKQCLSDAEQKHRKAERILCAAVRYYGDTITGYRHNNCIATIRDIFTSSLVTQQIQGFLTSKNRFVYRKEAGEIAYKAGQIDKPTDLLLSEDLY